MSLEEKNRTEDGTLYLVATPIGNLADVTERARKVLSEVSFVAAEDTRNSMKLLSHYGIRKELVSYYEHNKRASGERIAARLMAGESCALITDAGMPAISDPGEDLVRLCAERGIPVTVVPGACAAVSALALSALPTRRFCFEGFLPAASGERRRALEELANERRTMVFYEAPHKLRATLLDMRDAFGAERRIALLRELTKLNEEATRTTLGEATELFGEREPRGEYVIIVAGAERDARRDELLSLSVEEHIAKYMAEGYGKKEAAKAVAKDRGVSKSEIYKYTIEK